MKEVETGKDKIRKICDLLKKETLDPAKEEAAKIIAQAEEQARALIKKAEGEAKNLVQKAQEKIVQEKQLFEKQITQILQQAKELLRQEIANTLFNEGMDRWLAKEGSDPKLAAKMINTLVEAVEKEGLSVNFSAYLGASLSPEKVNAQLMEQVLQKLREKSVMIGGFSSGVQLQLHDRNMTLDMSDKALKELLGSLVRKDFRDLLFKK